MALEVVNELKLYGEKYAWFAGTKVILVIIVITPDDPKII